MWLVCNTITPGTPFCEFVVIALEHTEIAEDLICMPVTQPDSHKFCSHT